MTRILTGSVAVTNGDATFTWTGAPLTDANCPADAQISIDGKLYFVLSRTDTTHGELTRNFAEATGSKTAEIDPLNANAISLVKVSSSIATYSARLALLEADGKGLFYTGIGFTGANDPGPGKLARSALTWALTTELYLDVLDAGEVDATPLIDSWTVNTILTVRSLSTRAYAAYLMTSTASNQGPDAWRKLSGLSYIGDGGTGGPADDEDYVIEWNRPGSSVQINKAGTVAGRAAFDDQAPPFTYLATDYDWGDGTLKGALYVKNSAAHADWGPAAHYQGQKGDKGGDYYDLAFHDPGRAANNELVSSHIFDKAVSFAAGFVLSQAKAAVAATANAIWSIKKNGAEIGTITFATGQTIGTFAGAGGTFAAGDVLDLYAPSPRDDTLSNVKITLAGDR